jgi:hypothetical protein
MRSTGDARAVAEKQLHLLVECQLLTLKKQRVDAEIVDVVLRSAKAKGGVPARESASAAGDQ